jgi:hypothetical protein
MHMNKMRLLRAVLTTGLLATPAAWADGNAGLTEAQAAYADVDYENTRRLAKTALEHGGNDRAATAQLYLLWGTSAAALDQADEARTAFLYVLSMNPEIKLERTLSPKIRAPYLEARGAMAIHDGQPTLNVALQRRQSQLEIALVDAGHVVASVQLATRAREGEPFVRRSFEAAPRNRMPISNSAELQFFARALDRYGNALFELGNEDDPERLAVVDSGSRPSALAPQGRDVNRTPFYVTAGAFAVLGLAAGGTAAAMYLRREDAAHDWNGADCERPGSTRAQQCADVDARRQQAESQAIGFLAASGALLLGSVVTLVLTPSLPSKTIVSVGGAPGNMMLRLQTTL